MRSKLSTLLVAVLALAGTAAAPSSPNAPAVRCQGPEQAAQLLTMTVEGQTTTGVYAVPEKRPTALVVYAHGYSHTARSSWQQHVRDTAVRDGAVAVAMDYRGSYTDADGNRRGWLVQEGAEDSIAAARLFLARCRSIETVVLVGVSMGGNTGVLALAAQPTRADGSPLFDWYLHIEGVSNVAETWAGAKLLGGVNTFARLAATDIEAQMGGTPLETPATWAARNPITRARDAATSGVKGIAMVHAYEDGLATYDHARQILAAWQATGLPVELTSIARMTGEPYQGYNTTITGYVDGGLSPMAGHATESSPDHPIMVTAFQRLSELLAGELVACGERVIDAGEVVTDQRTAC